MGCSRRDAYIITVRKRIRVQIVALETLDSRAGPCRGGIAEDWLILRQRLGARDRAIGLEAERRVLRNYQRVARDSPADLDVVDPRAWRHERADFSGNIRRAGRPRGLKRLSGVIQMQ